MAQLEAAAVADPVDTTGADTANVVPATPDDLSSIYPDEAPEPETEPVETEGAEDGEGADYEDGDDTGEPQEAIAAPVSLKAEEKERFAQLPPEAQRFTADILARRDREVQQGLESARHAQREAQQSAADMVAQTQRTYAEQFEQFAEVFAPPVPERSHYPDDMSFLAAREAYRDQRAAFEQIKGQIQGLRDHADQHDQGRDAQWRQEQVRQLMSIPEFAAEETRRDFLQGIDTFGAELGYAPEDMANASARDVLVLKKAMGWKADADKWQEHLRRRNERPRQSGKFAKAAPAGAQRPATAPVDPLKVLYPND